MWMMHQALTPGVQDGEEADVGAEMFAIGGDRSQSVGGGPKEQIIDHGSGYGNLSLRLGPFRR